MLTVTDLFKKVGLTPTALKWGNVIPIEGNGVNVISLSSDPSKNNGIVPFCEISSEVFESWKTLSPELNVNGKISKRLIETELNRYWKPKENILYIGESTSKNNQLKGRVNQFYQHQVGWEGPHIGGYWIKSLSQLEDLFVYYAVCENPRDTEFKMLMHFIEQATDKSFYELEELGKHLPFANLKVDFQKKNMVLKGNTQKTKKEKLTIYYYGIKEV
jgi:hypothetical protein